MGATQAKPVVITADTSTAPLAPETEDFVMIGGKTTPAETTPGTVEPTEATPVAAAETGSTDSARLTGETGPPAVNVSDTTAETLRVVFDVANAPDVEINAVSATPTIVTELLSRTFDEVIDGFRAHVEAMDTVPDEVSLLDTPIPDTPVPEISDSNVPNTAVVEYQCRTADEKPSAQLIIHEILPAPEPIPIEYVSVNIPFGRMTETARPTPPTPPTPPTLPFRPLTEVCLADTADTRHSWLENILDVISQAFVGMLELPFESNATDPVRPIHAPSIFPVRVAQRNAIQFSLHLVYKYDNPASTDFRLLKSTFSDLSGAVVYSISEVAYRYAIDLRAAEEILMEHFHVTGASPHVYTYTIGQYTVNGFGIGSTYFIKITDKYNALDSWELYYHADDGDIVRYLRDIRVNSTLTRTYAMVRAIEFL